MPNRNPLRPNHQKERASVGSRIERERENRNGEPVGELGAIDKIESSSPEKIEETIRKNGQELERQG